MTLAETALLGTTIVAIVGAMAAIVRDRRKPRVDMASASQIESVVKEYADKSNARRDLRLLQVENWAYSQVRPWGWDAVAKFNLQNDMVRVLAVKLGETVPEVHLAPFPEMPPPLLPE